jgi:tetratricopeptide (TPR) repeat protein
MRERGHRWVRLILATFACGAFSGCAHDALSADEHHRFGAIYEAHGLPDEAVAQYKRAVRLNPADVEGWMALGNIQLRRANYASAARYFRRALKVNPDHAGALNNLAMTYLGRNENLGEAERLAMAALREGGPLKPYVLDSLAKIYEREGRYRDASLAAAQAGEAQAAAVTAAEDAASRDVTVLPSR